MSDLNGGKTEYHNWSTKYVRNERISGKAQTQHFLVTFLETAPNEMMDGVRGIPDQIWVAELIQPGSASVVDNQYGQFFPLFGNCLHTPATEHNLLHQDMV